MWDKTKIYKIGFFEWKANGDFWISRDPVDDEKRWVIEKLPAPCLKPFLVKYFCSTNFSSLIDYGENESYVALLAYCARLKQLTERVLSERMINYGTQEERKRAKDLIQFYISAEDNQPLENNVG